MKRILFLLPLLAVAAHAAPVPLFDGKSLEGWEGDPKLWRVEEGEIRGGSLTETVTQNVFLATKKSYANFDLRIKLRLSGTGFVNSGIQIRSLRVPGSSEMSGYQVDYGKGWYGKLYDESRRNKVVGDSVDPKAATEAIHEGEWNEYRIRADGAHIQSWINGVPALDYTEADPNIAQDGYIGIQVHSGGKALVQVKEVTIEELPATPGAPTWEKLGGVNGAKAKLQPEKKSPAGKDSDALENIGAGVKPPKGGPAPGSSAKTPDEERATFKVPDGFEVELVAAESEGIGKFVPLCFDQQGRLWTSTAFEYPVDGNENPAAADALYASHAKDKVLVFDRDPQSPTGLASKPRVFADGLAIPLGVLPYKNGCYVSHGHNIEFLEDTDGDGKADKRTVILTGFGVQDSHLFPHQFTRAPGGWIWMAQGAFDYGKVRRPSDPPEAGVQFDQCRMAKFRPDGAQFTITSNGPCNIWGVVINGEGEAFIQEANDMGYPVMPFHEFGNYPGCSDRQWKSYSPEFPGLARDFRMGGTGLSGLAILDEAWTRLLESSASFQLANQTGRELEARATSQTVLVANPITSCVQGIKMHRDGPYWKIDKPTDFLVSSDPWFRPVAITIGPDGCLYIVDWYNKIISHNEVPRNHPDRDRTRGRIWRVKAKAVRPFDVPDFTKLSGDELIAKLGGESLAQTHLAWQTLAERTDEKSLAALRTIALDEKAPAAKRIQTAWALAEHGELEGKITLSLLASPDRNVRREAVYALNRVAKPEAVVKLLAERRSDADPEVRATAIRALAANPSNAAQAIPAALGFTLDPIPAPLAPSTRSGKPIKVREAYDREFERYLVRMFLEQHPDAVAKFLDSDAAKDLPVEARLLACLALEPKASAARVAQLLPQLQRAPGQEEVLRLAQFPDEKGVGVALRAILSDPKTGAASLEALLAVRTRLDPAKLAPMLTDAAMLLMSSGDPKGIPLGIKLAGAFKLPGLERALTQIVRDHESAVAIQALRALAEIGSTQTELLAQLAESSPDALLRDEALAALAGSKAGDAPARVLALYPKLAPAPRRTALERLSATKPGAAAIVAALNNGGLAAADLDASILDRLQAVLGAGDPALAKLTNKLGALFRPVLLLDGSEAAWTQTDVTLDGPCTIEAWVRLNPEKRKIGNADGIAGAPGQLDFNFFGETPRVYVFPPVGDVVVAKSPVMPGLWTHVAATRDAKGIWKLYLDGELNATGTKPAPHKIERVRIAWTGAVGGTRGVISEVRLWNRERSADELRAASDRSLSANTPGLLFTSASGDWGKLQAGAKIVKTSDFPPILTGDEAAKLDVAYAKNRALAEKPGDSEKGKTVALLCQTCHLMGTTGGNIGPNLSGVGAMGTEAILRNIIQPNAAMENAYRIYRIELKNGDLVDALFVSEDKAAVVVRVPGSEDRRIPKSDIRSAKYLRRSLMPEGLLDGMTPEQVSDLFAYLKTLK